MADSRRAVLRAFSAAAVVLVLAAAAWTVNDERRKVAEAREAVERLADMQESYYRINGEYTDNLSRLADMTSGWFRFVDGLAVVIDFRAGFAMTADARGYRIAARARDFRRTEVVLEGPRPRR
jgi:Tfp pilus assembly protein PilE